jgi:hypothetical protein
VDSYDGKLFKARDKFFSSSNIGARIRSFPKFFASQSHGVNGNQAFPQVSYWTLKHHFLTSPADGSRLYDAFYGTFPHHCDYHTPQLLLRNGHQTSILWNMPSDANYLTATTCVSSTIADNIFMLQRFRNSSMHLD